MRVDKPVAIGRAVDAFAEVVVDIWIVDIVALCVEFVVVNTAEAVGVAVRSGTVIDRRGAKRAGALDRVVFARGDLVVMVGVVRVRLVVGVGFRGEVVGGSGESLAVAVCGGFAWLSTYDGIARVAVKIMFDQ